MEQYEIKLFKDKDYQVFTKDDLKKEILKIQIANISLDFPNYYKKDDTKEFVLMKTDYQNPFTVHDNILYINPKYYQDNKEEIDSILEEYLINCSNTSIIINNKELISDSTIDALVKNKNLKTVSLTPYTTEPYVLTEVDYQKFKNSQIEKVNTNAVCESLNDNFDSLIEYNSKRFLLGYNRFQDLIRNEEITLNDNLDDMQLKNLIYLNPKAVVKLNCSNDWVKKIIDMMASLNLKNKVVINLKDKESFNKFLLQNHLNYPNLYVYYDFDEIAINDYLRLEKKLYNMILEAKHMSPFERYIVAYNIVKKYKKYRESDNKEDARNLYRILENEYIVCRGFTTFFKDLLTKLGINSSIFSVTVDTSYDLANIGKEKIEGITKVTTRDYHSRCYVRLVDKKYGIDGFYITDPTWDNDFSGDYYNHLALTEDEIITSYRYNWLTNYSYEELLAVHSIEEFYEKINFFLDKLAKTAKDSENMKNIVRGLTGMYLDNLAPEFMETLNKKYPFLNSITWPLDISDLLYDIGSFIVNHVNKPISGTKIIEAVGEVYKNCYHYEESTIQDMLLNLKNINAIREETHFPKRSKIKDGEEVIINNNNKFEEADSNFKSK